MFRRQSDGWMHLWRMNSSWRRNLSDTTTIYSGTDAYGNAELLFQVDANNDSILGSVLPVETFGNDGWIGIEDIKNKGHLSNATRFNGIDQQFLMKRLILRQ